MLIKNTFPLFKNFEYVAYYVFMRFPMKLLINFKNPLLLFLALPSADHTLHNQFKIEYIEKLGDFGLVDTFLRCSYFFMKIAIFEINK